MSPYRVRAEYCPFLAPQARLDSALARLTAPLERSWAKLEAADTILLKVNMVYYPDRIRTFEGRRQELVDETVLRATLGLLRDRTRAKLKVVDTTLMPDGPRANRDVHFLDVLAEYGAEYVECNTAPSASFEVPGGGLMFQRYLFHPVFSETDAVVSVATLKTHAFMGVTLCTKNLFGLCPVHPANRPRRYYHHIVRMPYFLVDLGRTLRPCLNIIDGLVGQSRREWGGEARVSETLVAGDQVFATDVCAATLMGCDPTHDWPAPPFRRDRNHLAIAAAHGYGPATAAEVDFEHDLTIPVAEFDSDQTDPGEMVASWRQSMCEQALSFVADRARWEAEYPKEYILLQDGEVLWHGPVLMGLPSRRDIAGNKKDRAIWLKYVDPDDWEGERLAVYEQELAALTAAASPASGALA
ncbi:MAG: DUF362 domain-containing protein [Fimbriimonadaceae bacterium]|nr:DUF362 domain-containing protein [Fimbriimonadaceae bacterium]